MKSLRTEDPERIGGYRLLGRLGEGGMGSVYLAQSDRGRTVAVKLVRPELAGDEEFRARFELEVAAARRVGGAWTAPVLDADTTAVRPWVATGYVPGVSLHEAVAGRKVSLPVRTVRILANRLALALEAVHRAGLVHRDVKPSNILVTIDGPRVIDFGIARALETVAGGQLTRTGAVVGSPGFMSPEQVRGERLTAASDVFSLGAVLAFAATGRSPFGAGQAGHVLMYRITNEEPGLDGVPGELRALVAACLAKDAAERPTVADLLQRTADPEDAPGPTATDGTGEPDGADAPDGAEPWLPAGLVAHLGRHAANLLHAEVPGAREAAARAAVAPSVPLPPSTPPRVGPLPASAPPPPTTPPRQETPPAPPTTPPPGPVTAPPSSGTFRALGDAGGTGPPYAAVTATITSTGAPAPPASLAPVAPGGSRRRRAVLLASAVALAVVAGVGTFVTLRTMDGGEDGGSGRAPQGGRSPAGGGVSDGTGSGPLGTPGTVPKAYLGDWQVEEEERGDDLLHRFSISSGKEGDVVGTGLSMGERSLCTSELRLVTAKSTVVLTARLKESYPAGRCTDVDKEIRLKRERDATLTWTREESGTRTMRQADDGAEALPERMVGTWRSPGGDKERTLVVAQGAVGEAQGTNAIVSGSRRCELRALVGAVKGEAVHYGPGTLTVAEPGESACSGAGSRSSVLTLQGDDELLVTPKGTRRSGPPDVLERVD